MSKIFNQYISILEGMAKTKGYNNIPDELISFIMEHDPQNKLSPEEVLKDFNGWPGAVFILRKRYESI